MQEGHGEGQERPAPIQEVCRAVEEEAPDLGYPTEKAMAEEIEAKATELERMIKRSA
jgi:hypothetical protein